ncbi:MAG TPA: pyridoxamine 5'-phosphate oxidase family protein [Anaerolineales bacterium]|nr:pyridoxamine 5'-phosphate oxidase family protein [Anaerolineales bacterium]
MDSRMTVEERQAFLAKAWVGIISIQRAGRGPLSVPVWYTYQPGADVCIWTGANTRKGKLLQKAKRISFCVQDPTPPAYKYVSIEGPFTIQPVDPESDIRPMAIRYYGPEEGESYYADVISSDNWKNDILVRIRPERWYTADFGKLMAEKK